jgi:hypothetical protein
MTAAKLSPARARALGLDVPPSAGVTRRRNRRAVPGHGTTRCHDCGETFTSDAAETRHVNDNRGHCRYELELQ